MVRAVGWVHLDRPAPPDGPIRHGPGGERVWRPGLARRPSQVGRLRALIRVDYRRTATSPPPSRGQAISRRVRLRGEGREGGRDWSHRGRVRGRGIAGDGPACTARWPQAPPCGGLHSCRPPSSNARFRRATVAAIRALVRVARWARSPRVRADRAVGASRGAESWTSSCRRLLRAAARETRGFRSITCTSLVPLEGMACRWREGNEEAPKDSRTQRIPPRSRRAETAQSDEAPLASSCQ